MEILSQESSKGVTTLSKFYPHFLALKPFSCMVTKVDQPVPSAPLTSSAHPTPQGRTGSSSQWLYLSKYTGFWPEKRCACNLLSMYSTSTDRPKPNPTQPIRWQEWDWLPLPAPISLSPRSPAPPAPLATPPPPLLLPLCYPPLPPALTRNNQTAPGIISVPNTGAHATYWSQNNKTSQECETALTSQYKTLFLVFVF